MTDNLELLDTPSCRMATVALSLRTDCCPFLILPPEEVTPSHPKFLLFVAYKKTVWESKHRLPGLAATTFTH